MPRFSAVARVSERITVSGTLMIRKIPTCANEASTAGSVSTVL